MLLLPTLSMLSFAREEYLESLTTSDSFCKMKHSCNFIFA